MEKKKNCLFFIADQLRGRQPELSGNTELTTPNYDALADEGILFENAFCQSPIVFPAAAASIPAGIRTPTDIGRFITSWKKKIQVL